MRTVLISLLMLLPLSLLVAQDRSFTIVVDGQEETVTIPDGMSAEDAFLHMAVLYREAESDVTRLLQEREDLYEKIAVYIDEVDTLRADYDALEDAMDELVAQYQHALRPPLLRPAFGFYGGLDPIDTTYSAGVRGELLFFDSVGVSIGTQINPITINAFLTYYF